MGSPYEIGIAKSIDEHLRSDTRISILSTTKEDGHLNSGWYPHLVAQYVKYVVTPIVGIYDAGKLNEFAGALLPWPASEFSGFESEHGSLYVNPLCYNELVGRQTAREVLTVWEPAMQADYSDMRHGVRAQFKRTDVI
jgi:hypothetical protein